MSKCKLPKQPSKLLRIAFDDVRKIREMKRLYTLDMTIFHEVDNISQDFSHCYVCVAGAVMACTLKADRGKSLYPTDFKGCKAQLEAVDCFRTGKIKLAIESLYNEVAEWKLQALYDAWSNDMKFPEDDYADWSRAWRFFIKRCQEIGL